MQFRQLGRQLLEESPTVLTQLSGKFFILVKIGTGTSFLGLEQLFYGSEMRFSGLKLSFRTLDKAKGKY